MKTVLMKTYQLVVKKRFTQKDSSQKEKDHREGVRYSLLIVSINDDEKGSKADEVKQDFLAIFHISPRINDSILTQEAHFAVEA